MQRHVAGRGDWILARDSHRVVVIFVVDVEDGQSVRRRRLSGLQRFDDVRRFAQCMCRMRGTKVGPPHALIGIDIESRIGTARMHE